MKDDLVLYDSPGSPVPATLLVAGRPGRAPADVPSATIGRSVVWNPYRVGIMKKIEAIVPPSRLAAVQEALERRGIGEFTLLEVWVTGAEPGYKMLYRGTTHSLDLFPRAKLEVVCGDAYALPVAYAITDAARTGCAGDGGVLILAVDDGRSYERSAWRGVMRHSP